MTDFNELVENLATSMLGEDWEKKHAAKAAKAPEGAVAYHNDKQYHHQTLADFHRAAFNMVGSSKHQKLVDKHGLGKDAAAVKMHHTKSVRHQALAKAHRKLRDAHPESPYRV